MSVFVRRGGGGGGGGSCVSSNETQSGLKVTVIVSIRLIFCV